MKETDDCQLSADQKMLLRVDMFCSCFMEVLHLNKQINNNIQNVLEILINLSKLKGPSEKMSYVYGYLPYIKEVINEKSDDPDYHNKLLREFEKNMDAYFDELTPELSEESIKAFNLFIKTQSKLMKKELDMYIEMEKIHNKTTSI